MKLLRVERLFLVLLAVLVVAGFSPAPVLSEEVGVELAEQFLKKMPVTKVPDITMAQAPKVQEQFVEVISKEFGGPAGYKAGLTNPNVQKAFGVDQPVRGTLLSRMFLKDGSVIPAKFGAAPFSEGDLILRVGNEAINQAKTPQEALECIEAVIPFIELPDMVFGPGLKLTGPAIIAINVGARYGVLGKAIPVKATPEWMDRLKDFTLQIYDEKGNMVAEGKGSALLGHPIAVVLWIKDSLASEGKQLRKGDLLSLGTVTRMMPAKPGTTVKARYIGLDPAGPVEISVSFN